MAKLKAKGRTEILRVYKETETPDGELTTWSRKTRAYMTDGTVLEKTDVLFRPASYDPKPRRHSYGWTVRAKVKVGPTESLLEVVRRTMDKYREHGWTVEASDL